MKSDKFPILLVNAPSVTTSKVELPGDPVSILYASRVLFSALRDDYFRSSVKPQLIQYEDQAVYDPRIWDEKSRQAFSEILAKYKPAATFFCAYSPSHPYAIEMAREVKRRDPNCLVVFGGKHQDETIKYCSHSDRYNIEPSNTLNLIAKGEIPPIVDLVVSGEGEYPLKFINERLGQYISSKGRLDVPGFIEDILSQRQAVSEIAGRSIIGLFSGNQIELLRTNFKANNLLDFCSPYTFFPIKTRNPIFTRKDGTRKLTTNIITARGCKNSCIYCSESSLLNRDGLSRRDLVTGTLERVLEDIWLGSESAFFDDSVFFGGNLDKVQEFANRLIGKKKQAALQATDVSNIARRGNESERGMLTRLREFEYAVQFCVEDIVGEENKDYVLRVLKDLKESGCTYVYTGIESLDDKVMKNVQKFRYKNNQIYTGWFEKVDAALTLFKEAGIRVGASLLFGIPGETSETINSTLDRIKLLLAEKKLHLVSPNLCSYHPGTRLTHEDNMADKLDYTTIPVTEDSLMSFFEEASPKHLSKTLTRAMMEQIRRRLPELQNLNANTIEDSLNGKK